MRVYSRDALDRDGFAGFASGSWEVVRLRHHVPTNPAASSDHSRHSRPQPIFHRRTVFDTTSNMGKSVEVRCGVRLNWSCWP
jgi:hypothetical protein